MPHLDRAAHNQKALTQGARGPESPANILVLWRVAQVPLAVQRRARRADIIDVGVQGFAEKAARRDNALNRVMRRVISEGAHGRLGLLRDEDARDMEFKEILLSWHSDDDVEANGRTVVLGYGVGETDVESFPDVEWVVDHVDALFGEEGTRQIESCLRQMWHDGSARATRAPGIVPDNDVLTLLKRLMELDFQRAQSWLSLALLPRKSPVFVNGMFQIAAATDMFNCAANNLLGREHIGWLGEVAVDVCKDVEEFDERIQGIAVVSILLGAAALVAPADARGSFIFRGIIGACASELDDADVSEVVGFFRERFNKFPHLFERVEWLRTVPGRFRMLETGLIS